MFLPGKVTEGSQLSLLNFACTSCTQTKPLVHLSSEQATERGTRVEYNETDCSMSFSSAEFLAVSALKEDSIKPSEAKTDTGMHLS